MHVLGYAKNTSTPSQTAQSLGLVPARKLRKCKEHLSIGVEVENVLENHPVDTTENAENVKTVEKRDSAKR